MQVVHKVVYASGFLYHSGSAQILLQQNLSDPRSTWTLLECPSGKILGYKTRPVYDYVAKGKKYVISYAEVKKVKDFPDKGKLSFKWFTVKEISKLSLSAQTKQDIIVGHRVIASELRRDIGEQTIG